MKYETKRSASNTHANAQYIQHNYMMALDDSTYIYSFHILTKTQFETTEPMKHLLGQKRVEGGNGGDGSG